jgi:hypothetical protein
MGVPAAAQLVDVHADAGLFARDFLEHVRLLSIASDQYQGDHEQAPETGSDNNHRIDQLRNRPAMPAGLFNVICKIQDTNC